MRVLLADDQNEIRTLTTLQLERGGHRVVTVANGKEALEAFEREPFDAVLLDEEMPQLSGPQVARVIRDLQRQTGGRVVLVALTGNNTDEDRKRLLGAGFDAVLGKPFRMDALDTLFQIPSGPARPENLPAARRPSIEDDPVSILLDRVGGDEKLARKMIQTFFRDSPKRLAEIRRALERKNAEALASSAHDLKGAVGVFGAQVARDYAQELQEMGRRSELVNPMRVHERLKEEIARLQENLRGYAGTKGSPAVGAMGKTKRAKSKTGSDPR